ncbi:MAG: class B sortase [Oscillospiraceae bacterium]|nr:class B sortase [Oscillospiraceae bacterium]
MADMLEDILNEVDKKKRNDNSDNRNNTENSYESDSDDYGNDDYTDYNIGGQGLPVYSSEKAAWQSGRFGKFIRAVVPLKSDKPLEIVRKIVFITSLTIAVVCLVIILTDIREGKKHDATYDGIRDSMEHIRLSGTVSYTSDKVEEMLSDDPEALWQYAHELYAEILEANPSTTLTPERIFEILTEKPGILPQYIETYDRNNQLIGHLIMPDTPKNKLDYPVFQHREYDEDGNVTGSNSYYLEYDIDLRPSKLGTVFAEWRFPFTPTSRPDNTVLYGHNIADGRMFNSVVRYYPYYNAYARSGNIEYYRQYPVIQFDTIYEEGFYKVFAVIYVHTEEDRYDDVFDYFRWREIPDRETFFTFIVNIMDRSAFYTDVDLRYGDELLTLSTCYYPLGEQLDSRVVVFARRVRPGESTDVDLDASYVNPSPHYFDYYYRARGGSWAGREWDTSKVEGLDEWLNKRGDAPTHLLFSELQEEIAGQ